MKSIVVLTIYENWSDAAKRRHRWHTDKNLQQTVYSLVNFILTIILSMISSDADNNMVKQQFPLKKSRDTSQFAADI